MKKNIKNLTIKDNDSISIAVKKLNLSGKKFLAVINKKSKYMGSLTDSDIRRNILNNFSAKSNVSKIFNINGKFIFENNFSEKMLKKFFDKYSLVDAVPVLNKNKTINRVVFRKEIFANKTQNKFSCLILAGGLGQRLLPITTNTPKPLINFENVPYICKLIKKLMLNNVEKIFVSVYYKKRNLIGSIKKYFLKDIKNKRIVFISEKKPLGTAGSVKLIKQSINKLLIINSDVIFNFKLDNLFDVHSNFKNYITVVCSQLEEKIPYGVLYNNKFKLNKIVEKPSFSYLINTGIYLTSSNIKRFIKTNTKIQMTDLINLLLKNKKKVGLFPLNENIIDYGTHENLKEAKKNFGKYFYE